MNNPVAQIVGDSVRKEMKEIESRLIAAGYCKRSEGTGCETASFAGHSAGEVATSKIDCSRYKNFKGTYYDAIPSNAGCRGCACTPQDDECEYAPPCSKDERHDGVDIIWVLSSDQSSRRPNFNPESKEEIMNRQVDIKALKSIEKLEAEISKLKKEQDKRQKETEPKTITFAVPNELHDLSAEACNRPSFSIGCKLDGTDIVQFSPLTGNVGKRSEKHVSVEDYNTLQACIEKESYAEGDEFDKAYVQVAATTRLEELEAESSKLKKEQDKRQKETDSLVLELRQYVERYRNANTRAVAAEMKLADFVRQGVLKMTPNGHEPVLTREYIDETVFMCKIRANRMAEALHKYKYQKNNAYASDKDRETAETEYMTALQLFNDTFSTM